jgi:hypothetical protein
MIILESVECSHPWGGIETLLLVVKIQVVKMAWWAAREAKAPDQFQSSIRA